MIQTLKQLFDKKSPLFMITIVVFIVSFIAKGEPFNHNCSLSPQIELFETLLIITTGTQIFVKTILLEILSKCCISSIAGIHYTVVVFFIVTALTMYGWAIHIFLDSRTESPCQTPNEPHNYFIQVYSVLYTLIYLIIVLALISLKLQNKTMTVLGQDSNLEPQDQI